MVLVVPTRAGFMSSQAWRAVQRSLGLELQAQELEVFFFFFFFIGKKH